MSTEEAEPLATAAHEEAVAEPVTTVHEPVGEPIAAPQPEPYTASSDAAHTAPSGPRPELLLGGAFVSGIVLAKLLGRRHAG